MTAQVRLWCDCSGGTCTSNIHIAAQTTSSARATASYSGWDCDVIGGETVDWAPGHEITTTTGDAA